MKFFAAAFVITALVYLSGCALYYLQQDRLIFIGARPIELPSDPRIEPITHVVDGVSLRGVRVLAQEGDTVLLYFGGNAEPVGYNALAMLRLATVTAYLIDYRGYGDSDGRPSEGVLRSDALAHFDWVRSQHPQNRIVLVGRSLGSAIALHVAARREIDGIVLISPFTSLRDVAAFHLPWLPVRPLMKHPFDVVQDAQQTGVEALIVAGENDSVIPLRLTEALVRELPRPAALHVVPQAGHNDLMATGREWNWVRDYVRDLSR